MAIDSAEKRRSAAGVGFWLYLGVTPNASQDLEWRQQVAYSYSGIAVEEPVVTTYGTIRPRAGTSSVQARPRAGNSRIAERPRAGVGYPQGRPRGGSS